MTGAGNGYLSGNMLVPFPFEDGQEMGWIVTSDSSSEPIQESEEALRSKAQEAFNRCFVDASLYILDSAFDGSMPEIGDVSFAGTSMSFTVFVGDSSTQLSVSASEKKFPVASGSAGWGSYVVVLSSEGIRGFCDLCESNGILPPSHGSSSSSSGREGNSSMKLCARCVTRERVGIRSIKVYDGVGDRSSGPHFVLSGDVAIVPGNNMTLSEPEDVENGIELSAVPGAGTGIVSCGCRGQSESDSTIISPDGHTRIFNDTCYDIEPGPVGTVVVDGETRRSRKLFIHAKCTSCCTCEMYASIVNDKLAALATAVRSAKSGISGILHEYESGVDAFNRRIYKPKLSDVTVTISGMPIGENLSPKLGNTGVKGKMGRCAFTAIVRNMSFACIDAKISSMTGTNTIVDAVATWSKADGSALTSKSKAKTGLSGSRFYLYPGRSLVINFVSVADEMVGSVGSSTYKGTIAVNLSYDGPRGSSGTLGNVTRSVEV